jgi:hypothetical protein
LPRSKNIVCPVLLNFWTVLLKPIRARCCGMAIPWTWVERAAGGETPHVPSPARITSSSKTTCHFGENNPFHQLRLERLCFWRSIPVDRHHSRGSHVCRDRFAKPADKREIRTHPASGFPWRVNVASYYYQREIPRLCRGGSRSLTFPGVHPETLRREPPSTRRGETGWTSMPA